MATAHILILLARCCFWCPSQRWRRRWRTVAAVAFALAVAVKFLAHRSYATLLAAIAHPRRLAGSYSLSDCCTFRFWNTGRIPFDSLSTYVQRFRFNVPVFATLERVASPQIVAGFAVLVGFVTAVWLRRKDGACSADKWAWPMAASLACAPVVYPWYLLWLLPFLRSTSTLPLMVWTISILPTYFVWHLRSLGQEWQVPGWMLLLEYGAVAIAVAIARFAGGKPIAQASPDGKAHSNNYDQRWIRIGAEPIALEFISR